jgi:hypothetical protein
LFLFIRKRVDDEGDAEGIRQEVFYELIEAYCADLWLASNTIPIRVKFGAAESRRQFQADDSQSGHSNNEYVRLWPSIQLDVRLARNRRRCIRWQPDLHERNQSREWNRSGCHSTHESSDTSIAECCFLPGATGLTPGTSLYADVANAFSIADTTTSLVSRSSPGPALTEWTCVSRTWRCGTLFYRSALLRSGEPACNRETMAYSSSGFRCEAKGYPSAYAVLRRTGVFKSVAYWHWTCKSWRDSMDANNARSANLGTFVILVVVPIVMYILVWLVLPWIAKG